MTRNFLKRPQNRSEFKATFAERISTRIHMSVLLFATIGAGVLFSKILLHLEMSSMALRYSLAILFSYATFFLLLRLWIKFHFETKPIQRSEKEYADELLVDAVDSIYYTSDFSSPGIGTSQPSTLAPKSSSSSMIPSMDDSDELGALILFVLLVAAIFGSSVWIIYQAPEIMLEAAFEVVLTSAIARRTRNIVEGNWLKIVFRKTWLPLTIVVVIGFCFGTYLKTKCPAAISYRQYVQMCTK